MKPSAEARKIVDELETTGPALKEKPFAALMAMGLRRTAERQAENALRRAKRIDDDASGGLSMQAIGRAARAEREAVVHSEWALVFKGLAKRLLEA